MREPAATVIIPTRDRPGPLLDAVTSVLASSFPDFELLVVDQSTDRRTERAVGDAVSDRRVRSLRMAPAGASAARNAGIRHARAPLVLFTDDDCVVTRHWLGIMVEWLTGGAAERLAFGPVLPPDRGTPHGAFVPTLDRARPSDRVRTRGGLVLGMTANMAMHRGIVEAIGGFDETLGPGTAGGSGEDIDFALRARAAGYRARFVPEAAVIHRGGVRRGAEMRGAWLGAGRGVGGVLVRALQRRQARGVVGIGGVALAQTVEALVSLLTRHRTQGVSRTGWLLYGAACGIVPALRSRPRTDGCRATMAGAGDVAPRTYVEQRR